MTSDPTAPAGHPHSAWATSAPDGPDAPPLGADTAADVAVIGAGFTGLAAAEAVTARGASCVVVDAADIGWGASGRNGGFAVPRYKMGVAALAERYGADTARALHRMVLETIDSLEATVANHGIPCHFARVGHITAAHGEAALDALRADARWLAREAGDTTPRVLERAEAREEIGTERYRGGLLDPRGATLHPLAYCRGLARALIARGVAVHGGTEASAVEETGSGVTVHTPGGRISAGAVVFASNAYTRAGLAPGRLERRLVPVASSVVATEPLSERVAAQVLPGRRAVSDTKHLMHYFRRLPDGGLLFGGRGDITGRRDDPAIYRGLEAAMTQMFPALADTAIAHRWSGLVGVTPDGFPHVGRLGRRMVYAMGYGGRGVALSHLLGRHAAQMALGETVAAGPMSDGRFRPIPFHGFRVPAMRLVAGWYGLKDRRAQEDGRRREDA